MFVGGLLSVPNNNSLNSKICAAIDNKLLTSHKYWKDVMFYAKCAVCSLVVRTPLFLEP